MDLRNFCGNYVYLRQQPISFADRPYLDEVYASVKRNLILRCSRQVEKSTLLCNMIIYAAIANPGTSMIFVCPRQEQAATFSKTRLIPAIEQSPLIRRTLFGQRKRSPPVMNLSFVNGSQLHVRAAYHSADPARGLSADMLFVDEFQDIADKMLPVLQETLSHSSNPRVILTATPKGQDNHVEAYFQQSTGCEWHIPCLACGKSAIPDLRMLGLDGLVCPACQAPVSAAAGCWVPRNPQSTWGDGYWINHLMVSWLQYSEILQRQSTYDAPRFLNECLGLPTSLGDHLITREEMEACCRPHPMAMSWSDVPNANEFCLIAGVDWGGGSHSATVVTIGYIRADKTFVVVRFEQLRVQEDPAATLNAVARLCSEFRVRYIGADAGGNGSVYNRLLLDKLGNRVPMYAFFYAATTQAPRQNGALHEWTVDRTGTIGSLFSRIKKQMTLFPRVEDSGSFLDQFTCEVAEYDEYQRTVRYTCPDNLRDDALHSLNYAQLVGLRLWQAHAPYGE